MVWWYIGVRLYVGGLVTCGVATPPRRVGHKGGSGRGDVSPLQHDVWKLWVIISVMVKVEHCHIHVLAVLNKECTADNPSWNFKLPHWCLHNAIYVWAKKQSCQSWTRLDCPLSRALKVPASTVLMIVTLYVAHMGMPIGVKHNA